MKLDSSKLDCRTFELQIGIYLKGLGFIINYLIRHDSENWA